MSYPVQLALRTRYSEIDPQGVVFNAHYLSYFDSTINEAFRPHGINWLEQMKASGCDVQLVKSVVEYRAPIHFDEQITCGARVDRVGRSSVVWALAIWGEQPGDLRATGEIVWVYADLAAKASRPLPDWMREILNTLNGEAP